MKRSWRTMIASSWFLPAGLLVFCQWEIWVDGQAHPVGPLWVTAGTIAIATVLLGWRREWPLPVQLGVVAVTFWPWAVYGAPQNTGMFLVGMVSTYAVGRWARRPAAYLAVPVAIIWTLSYLALDPLQSSVAAGWGWALWGVGIWAAGAWVRQRAELENRRNAERLVAARAELAEQRLDIARDLHDVLANSLGVIVLHAEAAEALLATDPDRATQAIRRVQSTGREALREVRELLGSIRDQSYEPAQTDDRESPGPSGTVTHKPDLGDVDSLIQRMRSAGLPLTYQRDGDDPLPAAVSQVVYRLLQEALSNTIRHAGLVPTSAHVVVANDVVTVEVTNDSPPDHAEPGLDEVARGNGLRGMEERLQALGGTLDLWRPPAGGLRVRTVLPLTPPEPVAPAVHPPSAFMGKPSR
jgi:signal transduction histidine kinase